MSLNGILQEKFPHLELSVLKLSEVKRDNATKRIDSEYFKKEYLENEEKTQTYLPLGKFCLIRSGITPKDRDENLKDGVILLKTTNIRNSILSNTDDYFYIDKNTNIKMKNTQLKEGDVLINIVGATTEVIGRVALIPKQFNNANITQAMAFCRVINKIVSNSYLFIVLQTKNSLLQIKRVARPTGQFNLNLEEVKQIKIPLLPMPFQLEIEKLVKDSHLALEQSKALYKEAEDLLYTELGLNPQNPLQSILQSHSNDINFRIATLKESFLKIGRLDSEYYQVKYEEIEKRIKTYTNGYCKLKDIVVSFSGGFAFSSNEYLENGDLALIRINNIKNANLDMNNAVYLNDEAISLSPKDKVKKGDVLISMSGSIGLSCVVRENLQAMVNQRILKISIDNFNADVLVLLLNSVLCKLQFERIGTGGVQTNLATSDILNILIPKINPNTQDSIASHIQQSFTLRAEAKALLNEAKAKVESAIIGGGGK